MFASISTPLAGVSAPLLHCCKGATKRSGTIKSSRRRSPLPLCRCGRCGLGHGQLIHVFEHWVS